MRLGLIGFGRIGAFHATTLSGLTQVESLVVYDAVPALVESAVQRVGAEPAASPEALLRAGVDGVVIAAATDVHPELIIACLEAGLPTFCEKPVSKDPAASMEILRRTEDSGVPVQIGYPRRFDAAFAAAREAVASGSLGWLHTVRSTTLDPAPPPDDYVRASGGIFRDCSVHDFDAIRYVTGQEVVEVYATGSNQGAASAMIGSGLMAKSHTMGYRNVESVYGKTPFRRTSRSWPTPRRIWRGAVPSRLGMTAGRLTGVRR